MNDSAPPPAPELDALQTLLAEFDSRTEAEKQELASRLHGELGSSLTALSMHLTLLAKKMPLEAATAERLDKMKGLLQNVTETARAIEAGLRPGKLDAFGLKTALNEGAQEFSARSGIACRVSLPDEELAYPPQIDLLLWRVMEEALQNVQRHAGASQVEVILDDSEDEIMLAVRDDGRGMNGAGFLHGLRMAQQRLRQAGGGLEVVAGKSGGTILRATLPKA